MTRLQFQKRAEDNSSSMYHTPNQLSIAQQQSQQPIGCYEIWYDTEPKKKKEKGPNQRFRREQVEVIFISLSL